MSFLAAAVLVALLLSFGTGASLAYDGSEYTWIIQNPVPQGTYLYATTAASTAAYWSVGTRGTILFWNGSTMTSQNSGTTSNLFAVDSSSTTSAFAVGQSKTILYYNGTSWSSQTAPTPAGGYGYDLCGVYTTSATSAWAVGGQDGFNNAIILHLDAGGWHIEAEYATGGFTDVYGIGTTAVWVVGQNTTGGRTLFWNGSTWALRDTANAPISVSAYDANNVWIVCWNGTVARSTNGGVAYTTISNLTTDWPVAVCAFSAANVWVVGWNGTIKRTINPTANPPTWTTPTTSDSFTGDLYDVFEVSTAATGVCIAGDGRIYTGYTSFTSRTTNVFLTYGAYGVSSYDANNVWACGGNGYVVRSTNGGVSWSTQLPGGTTNRFNGICAQDSTHVWAVNSGGKIYKWNGSAWSNVGPSTTELFDVDGASASVAWACGGSGTNKTVVFKTTDGWTSWGAQSGRAIGPFYGVAAPDVNNCWVVGIGGAIRKTTDGTNWSTQTSNTTYDLNDVTALDASTAWAVGNNGVIRYTSNGGTNWVTQDVGGVTTNLRSVSAVDATHVWAVGENNLILFYNGTSWATQTCPAGTSFLDHVVAQDSTHAWAVGSSAAGAGYILYADPPYIKACQPGSGAPGETVSLKITGGYTSFDQSTSQVVFSGAGVGVVPGTLNVANGETLYVDVSIDAGASLGPRDVNVLTGLEDPVPLTGGFAVGPRIEGLDPTRGVRGWTGDVGITGKYTNFSPASQATFGDGVTVNSTQFVDAEHVTANLTVDPSADPGARTVNVTTGTETPEAFVGGFTVPNPPGVAGISPESGTSGNEVTVSGGYFGDAQATDACVLFNGVPATDYVEWSRDEIVCRVPENTATGPVTVTTPDGGSNADKIFNINQAQTVPSISSISPASGPVGTGLTVRGAGFGPSQGQSHVTFGEKMAVCSSWSDREIRCTVPSGAIASAAPGVVQVKVTTAAGTSNPVSFTVKAGPGPAATWYLAEGSTAWGFQTYITIENPNDEACTASIKYNTGSGAGMAPEVALPARSQTTVNPASVVPDQDFSTQVTCLQGKTIAVDRTMFWTGPGAPSPEAHSSIGVTSPSKTWYLPEGSSAWNFETWTLVENPNAQDAHVSLTYMVEGATGPKVLTRTVPAYSRASFDMASDLGMHADASIKVTADQPVIAEGSTYRNNRREGSCSVGATAPAADYFLSEGSTAWGFTTYVLVQNPNSEPATVTLTYMTPQGPKAQPPFTMSANSRKTIRVNDALTNTDFSTQVQSTKPIIASRSMYWGAGSALGEACHASIGLSSAHMTFYLPDGQTSNGYETYTLVQNPNPGAVTVRITYLPQGGGKSFTFTDEIGPNSRKTYSMADKIPSGRASIMVQSLDGARPVMVERSMYWNSRGAGTGTIGGYSD